MAKQKPPDNHLVELKFASDDYKNFLEEKAKYVFELLFGKLQMMGVWHQRKFREIESSLLLGSMYLRSWLIQLNRSYKYNENIAHTGISTLNGCISKPVALREKLKKIEKNEDQLFFDFGFR